MKVLLINGSPHENGCTYTALSEMVKIFNQENIQTEIYHIGNDPISPCRACYTCAKLGKCVINDKVNDFVELAREFDGFVIGSPVHYASVAGNIAPFLHRAFFVASRSNNNPFAYKPATAIVSARRAGTTATLDQLNKYFQIQQMPIISGRYWNMVHGSNSDELKQDLEGMQNMRFLARNFVYHLKCREAGLKLGINPPEHNEEVVFTNFIH